MLKLCIFDLDGTLGDTRRSLISSVAEMLREMNLPAITDEQCISFVGNGARYLVERALEAGGKDHAARFDEAMKIYERIFDKNCTCDIHAYEGIRDTLDRMHKEGVKLAVLSNKPHKQTEKVINAMFGDDIFAYVQGQKEHIPRKPDPDALYGIMSMFEVQKEDCLYVGDSEVDIRTGKNAGVRTVGVSWGFRTKEELKEAGAEYIIDRADELLQFVCLPEYGGERR